MLILYYFILWECSIALYHVNTLLLYVMLIYCYFILYPKHWHLLQGLLSLFFYNRRSFSRTSSPWLR